MVRLIPCFPGTVAFSKACLKLLIHGFNGTIAISTKLKRTPLLGASKRRNGRIVPILLKYPWSKSKVDSMLGRLSECSLKNLYGHFSNLPWKYRHLKLSIFAILLSLFQFLEVVFKCFSVFYTSGVVKFPISST